MPAPRDLMRAMLTFGGVLRSSGLPVTTPEVMDAVRALEAVDLMDREQVYLALRAVLVSRREEMPAFDRCFDAFWKFHADEGQGLDGLIASPQAMPPDEQHGESSSPAAQEKAQIALDDWEDEGAGAEHEPAPQAHAERRNRGSAPQHARQSDEGRDHRASPPVAAAPKSAPGAALRRLGLHGSV